MKRLDAHAILDRAREHFGVETDTSLAPRLSVAPCTPAGWRYRNSVDLARLISACPDADLNWLLRGDEEAAFPHTNSDVVRELASWSKAVEEGTEIEQLSEDVGYDPEDISKLLVAFWRWKVAVADCLLDSAFWTTLKVQKTSLGTLRLAGGPDYDAHLRARSIDLMATRDRYQRLLWLHNNNLLNV